MSASTIDAAIAAANTAQKIDPNLEAQIRAIAKDEWNQLSAQEKCYALLLFTGATAALAVYGLASADWDLLATLGGVGVPLYAGIRHWCKW